MESYCEYEYFHIVFPRTTKCQYWCGRLVKVSSYYNALKVWSYTRMESSVTLLKQSGPPQVCTVG